jgi:hypothetical protein
MEVKQQSDSSFWNLYYSIALLPAFFITNLTARYPILSLNNEIQQDHLR